VNVNEILTRFPAAKKSGNGWTAKCPAHDDGTASLSISEGDDGRTLINCHAGCTANAICAAIGIRTADLFAKKSCSQPSTKPPHSETFDWLKCVAVFTEAEVQKLAIARGLSVEFVRWLHAQKVIGLYERKIAFANHGEGGKVVSCHFKLETGIWIFKPTGQKTAPLIFGDAKSAGYVFAFESQWDAFAVMDKLGWHAASGLPDTAVFITRGAGNGKLIRSRVNSAALVYAFKQNDAPTAKNPIPAGDIWLADVASNAGCKVLSVATPAPHADANDWTRAGATESDLRAAMKAAKPVQPGIKIEPSAPDSLPGNEEPPETITPQIDIGARLALVRFNILAPPPLETAVFKLSNGTPTHTRGNLSQIVAQAKAGKSAFLTALAAGVITTKPDDCDLLGWRAVNPDALPLAILDTEHSPAHNWKLGDRILRRAMLTESAQLHLFRLAGFTVRELNAALDFLLKERKWHSVFLDGTGDFVSDVNDAEECNAFVARQHGLAIEYDTHIFNVLHLNPTSETKSRGHLGSQLERKAETNLRIEKKDGVSIVYADRNRGADIPKDTAPRFLWSADHQMHISADSIGNLKKSASMEELREQCREAFNLANKSALTWTDLVASLLRVPGVNSKRTAERIHTDAKRENIIVKNIVGQWELSA
jgi:hypothetical protein